MHDGVGFADVGQELVAQAFALGGAGDQAGDVHELDDGRLDLLRLDDFGQLAEARIRHLDDADVRLDGAERIVLGRDAGLVRALNRVDLPTLGRPTIPHLRDMVFLWRAD